MKKDSIPKPLLEQVESELLSGENLLWVGVPDWRRMPASGTSEPLITALIVGMLIAFVMATVLLGMRGALSIIGLVLMLAMLIAGTISSSFLNRLLIKKRQIYAITSRRIIIMNGNRVQSFAPQDIEFIERKMHADGTGNILFKMPPPDYLYSQRQTPIGFFGIENPGQVEALMLETFRGIETHASRLALELQPEDDLEAEEQQQRERYS